MSETWGVVTLFVAVMGAPLALTLLGGSVLASPAANAIYAVVATIIGVFCTVRAVHIVRSHP